MVAERGRRKVGDRRWSETGGGRGREVVDVGRGRGRSRWVFENVSMGMTLFLYICNGL